MKYRQFGKLLNKGNLYEKNLSLSHLSANLVNY